MWKIDKLWTGMLLQHLQIKQGGGENDGIYIAIFLLLPTYSHLVLTHSRRPPSLQTISVAKNAETNITGRKSPTDPLPLSSHPIPRQTPPLPLLLQYCTFSIPFRLETPSVQGHCIPSDSTTQRADVVVASRAPLVGRNASLLGYCVM